jgi:hypothetical protein
MVSWYGYEVGGALGMGLWLVVLLFSLVLLPLFGFGKVWRKRYLYCDVRLNYMLCYAMLCYAMLCYAMLCGMILLGYGIALSIVHSFI